MYEDEDLDKAYMLIDKGYTEGDVIEIAKRLYEKRMLDNDEPL